MIPSNFLKIHINIIFHLRLGLPNGLFPSGFPTNTLCTPLSSPIHATCPAHLIRLDFTTRTILGKEYRSFSSSLRSFLHSPDICQYPGKSCCLQCQTAYMIQVSERKGEVFICRLVGAWAPTFEYVKGLTQSCTLECCITINCNIHQNLVSFRVSNLDSFCCLALNVFEDVSSKCENKAMFLLSEFVL